MKITPTPLSINQFFSTNNEQFYIPAYQRRYSWGYKQLIDLYNDIYYLKSNESHLLGTVVALTENHIAGINKLEIVDGQQRTTTLSILLRVILERMKSNQDTEGENKILGLIYCSGIDRKRVFKVELGDLDEPDYQKVMFQEDLNLIKNQNLKEAYDYFSEWITPLSEENFNEFYYKLINNVKIIRLDVSHSKDAYKLFESINNRGLSLSSTDIIKNFLLGHASILGEEILEKVKNFWKELIINLDGTNSDQFFRQYMCCILKRKITYSKLMDEFKKYYLKTVLDTDKLSEYQYFLDEGHIQIESDFYENEGDEINIENEQEDETLVSENTNVESEKISIMDYAKTLRNYSDLYSKIVNRKFNSKKINSHLLNLQRINSVPSYIFLIELFNTQDDETNICDILTIIEIFMLRRHLCERRTSELDTIFSGIVNIVPNLTKPVLVDKLRKYTPEDNEFQRKFNKHDHKGNENRAKYILENLEYEFIENQNEYVLNNGNDVHLEHIIPKTIHTKKAIKEFGDWPSYLGENHKDDYSELVNNIGNLTILGRKLNIIASNNPYESKKNEYQKSNIQITKFIPKKYPEFRLNDVRNRANELSLKAVKIWSYGNGTASTIVVPAVKDG